MGKPKRKRNRGQKTPVTQALSATFHSSALQSIRRHARSSPEMEICGVLVGEHSSGRTLVVGAIEGEGAAQGDAHVTFTQETWVSIHKEKDAQFPDQAIVGWYHSHPGFGVFLSDHDLFIHENFFSGLEQLAWVYDPHSDEEACFGWEGGEVRRLSEFDVIFDAENESTTRNESSPNQALTGPLASSIQRSSFFQDFGRDLQLIAIGCLLGLIVTSAWIFVRQPLIHNEIRGGMLQGPSAYVVDSSGKIRYVVDSSGKIRYVVDPNGKIRPLTNSDVINLRSQFKKPEAPKEGKPSSAGSDQGQIGGRHEQP